MSRTDRDVPLILFNPVGNDADCWQFLHLENAIPAEYPGHGKQPRRPGWTYDRFADEVASRFEGPVDLLGVSMGSATVAHFLIRHPEKVRSAIIACSGAFANAVASPEAQAAHRKTLLGRGQAAVEGGMQAVLEETLRRWFTPLAYNRRHAGMVYAEKTLLEMDPYAWDDIWRAGADSPLLNVEDLKAIEQPVTIIGGMHDAASGLTGLGQLHGLIRNSRYEILAAPHMIHLEAPETMRAAINRHLAWVQAGNRIQPPLGSFGRMEQSLAETGGL